ncbi:MAG: hypothetical protein ABSD88_20760 [Candidatus Korobacteraceae bacterium]|jgi:hypothetical protein
MKRDPHERVLAIDLRARRFGYVAFEKREFLEAGSRHYGRSTELLRKKLVRLLVLFAPGTVVLRTSPKRQRERLISLGPALKTVRSELRKRSIHLKCVDARRVRNHFLPYGLRNKHDVAVVIAEHIPALQPFVPPERDFAETEHHRETVFDAAAAGVWYLGTEMFGIRQEAQRTYLS